MFEIVHLLDSLVPQRLHYLDLIANHAHLEHSIFHPLALVILEELIHFFLDSCNLSRVHWLVRKIRINILKTLQNGVYLLFRHNFGGKLTKWTDLIVTFVAGPIQFAFDKLILLKDLPDGCCLIFDFGAKVLIHLTGEIDTFQAICYPLDLTLMRSDILADLLDLPQNLMMPFPAFFDGYVFFFVLGLDHEKVFILFV